MTEKNLYIIAGCNGAGKFNELKNYYHENS